MSAEGEVVWKCGACNECYYDLQILANHKCMGTVPATVAISESCLNELQVQRYVSDLENSNDGQVAVVTPKKRKGSPPGKKGPKAPTGKRSLVWNFFTALDEKKATCVLCHKVCSYCGSPTNLVYHLSRYHPKECSYVRGKGPNKTYMYLNKKLPRFNYGSSPRTVDKQNKLVPYNPCQTVNVVSPVVDNSTVQVVSKKQNLTEKIIEMLLVDMLPMDMLEGKGFKGFVSSLDPSYKVPEVKDFLIEHIPKRYFSEHKKAQEACKEAESVHLSAELWKGSEDKDFLTVSAHFLTRDFRYRQFALNTFVLEDVSGDIVTASVLSCVAQWDLSAAVRCVIHDGGDVVSAAVQATDWAEVVCFSHTLNDIIRAAIGASTDLALVVAKCRAVVDFVRANDAVKEQLQEKCLKHTDSEDSVLADAFKKIPMQVKRDNPNEWISTFYMLQRIFTLRNALTEVLRNSLEIDDLTRKDWTTIEEIVSLLKACEAVTTELCSEPQQFASKVLPVTLGLHSLIDNCSLTLISVEMVRRDILAGFRNRLGEIEENSALAISTILDPRFKNIAFQSEEAVEAAIAQITVEASNLVTEDMIVDPVADNNSACKMMSASDSLWAGFERKATPKKASNKKTDIVNTEIKNYLQDTLLDRKKDPFLWWRVQGQALYPVLSKLARKYICIPATAVPSERVFLKRGRLFSEKRKLLKPKYVDQFMFLNSSLMSHLS